MAPRAVLGHRIKNAVWSEVSSKLFYTGRLAGALGLQPGDPTFIVGTGRCGTDLLVDVLRSHRSIVGFPAEGNELWHPTLYPFERATLEHPPIEIDPRAFTVASLKSWPPGQAAKIRQTFAGFSAVFGFGRSLIVKSAMVSFMLPRIVEIFPEARFIHLYRSGPSVVESYIKKNFGTYPDYSFGRNEYRLYCARYWNECILEIERARTSLALQRRNAYFELSYEDFCSDPTLWCERLARYLGVEKEGFGFDLSSIKDQNYKVGDYATDPRWFEPLKAMEPAMRLKGYIA